MINFRHMARHIAKDPQLMDVTIREGSYLLDNTITLAQVREIAKAIDEAGIPYIEVGNGIGLGAFEIVGAQSHATDIEQLQAAKRVVKKCKVGLIANVEPFTKKEHIDAICGEADFLRIVVRADHVEAAKSNVAYARSLKIPVFLQLMRSSKCSLKEIVKAAKKAETFGPNVIYLVDSIGWFLPNEVGQIIKEMKRALSVPVGFHGHNNLMLAVANSLAAVEAGADFVDASLLGFGRDAGNAQLEALVAVLKREGKLKKIDCDKLILASQKWVSPITPEKQGAPPYQVASGYYNVCLYPMEAYQQIAKDADIDFLTFLKKLGSYPETEPDIKRALKELTNK